MTFQNVDAAFGCHSKIAETSDASEVNSDHS